MRESCNDKITFISTNEKSEIEGGKEGERERERERERESERYIYIERERDREKQNFWG